MTGGFLNTFLNKGYDPTRNQSEFGVPQRSATGQAMQAASGAVLGKPTLLPGPFHFLNQWGFVTIGTYVTVPVVMPKTSFGGEVPLSTSPAPKRPEPWKR